MIQHRISITLAVALALVLAAGIATRVFLPAAMRHDGGAPAADAGIEVLTSLKTVNEIALDDRTGDAWVATTGGLIRWNANGTGREIFTSASGLPSNKINDVAVAPDGSVWIGTVHGAARRGKDGRWTTVVPPALRRQAAADTGSSMYKLSIESVAVAPDGTVWLGASYGLFHVNASGGGDEPGVVGAMTVREVAVAPSGDVWFLSQNKLGVRRADATMRYFEMERIRQDLGLTRRISVNRLTIAPDGRLWLRTSVTPDVVDRSRHEGLATLDADGRAQRIEIDDATGQGSESMTVLELAFDRDGQPWVGTTNGVRRLTAAPSGRWTVEPQFVDVAEFVSALAFAADGAVWLGTGRNGTLRVAPSAASATPLAVPGPDTHDFRSIALDANGNAWFGTFNMGALRYGSDGTWETVDVDDGLPDNRVADVAVAPDGAVWFATGSGVTRRAPSGRLEPFVVDESRSPRDVDRSLSIGPTGDVWLVSAADPAEDEAVRQWREGHGWKKHDASMGRPDGAVTSILAARDGSVWVGQVDHQRWVDELGPIDTALVRFRVDEGWDLVDVPGLAEDAEYLDMAEAPDGTLWILTSEGIVGRAPDGGWTTPADDDRLASDPDPAVHPSALAVGPDGSVWLGGRQQELRRRLPNGKWQALRGGALDTTWIPDLAMAADGRAWVVAALSGGTGVRIVSPALMR